MPNTVRENPDYPTIVESESWLARARGLVPALTQTLAKGPGQYVRGVAPVYASRAKGSHLWDVDGNEYIDWQMAIGPIVLGYGNDAVDEAIRRQLSDGITFSLVHPLEVEVAERIRDTVPNAEMVRFSKTGCDVTTAAVRLARAFTGRDRVLCCGYHGWHDWYVGTTDRHAGIPDATRDLTSTFQYNDLDSVRAGLDRDVACVVLEPVTFDEPRNAFLHELKRLCVENGSLLVFDEMWTGFRVAIGGAQQRYDVTADLACFSKAVANGMPLSVLTGRRDVMTLLERQVFFFTTFGGEALSLAAARATIDELRAQDVPSILERRGTRLAEGVRAIARDSRHGLRDVRRLAGAHARLVHLQRRRSRHRPAGPQVTRAARAPQARRPLGRIPQPLPRSLRSRRRPHPGELEDGARAREGRGGRTSSELCAAGNARRARLPEDLRLPHKADKEAGAVNLERFSMKGKTAIVTGAVGLLGREHCHALGEAGANVVVTDLDPGACATLARDLGNVDVRAIASAADITQKAELQRLRDLTLDRFGGIDVLVNNAAIDDKFDAAADPNASRFEDYSLDRWRRSLDVNVTGTFLCCQVFGTEMAHKGSGSIINVASTYGVVSPDQSIYRDAQGHQRFFKSAAYPVSKAGVIALSRYLATYWGKAGVRVNTLSPGGVQAEQDAHFVENYARRTPIGRMARRDEYRGALVFLASDASSYLTGFNLVVDGGWTAW